MSPPLASLGQHYDPSWLRQLLPDPEAGSHAPNKAMREVRSGHYVLVRPTPLPKPRLVIHSPLMARALGISEEEVASPSFAAFFSGEQSRVRQLESWCTPYALAIMGEPMYHNCPFGNGNGYGDGRAISVGELVVGGQRWEMQLKGAGTTPFCRGADGRAVLRSSVREFLASEAMHHLGVETTRALALVASAAETVQRPWYSGRAGPGLPHEPDAVAAEPCAITTRVAPSFLRVGHLDHFARRARAQGATEAQRREHERLVEHALFREYGGVNRPDRPLAERAEAMLEAAAGRFADMVAGWLRVGFCQGNFNSDNCLISGRTMDYGPFGWMELYDPGFAKWVGSGAHFAFMNQPNAAIANYFTLVTAVMPVLGDDPVPKARELIASGASQIREAAADVWRVKLGFASASTGGPTAATLWADLEPLMNQSAVDYTIFWRQLPAILEKHSEDGGDVRPTALLAEAFYLPASEGLLDEWDKWIGRWLSAVRSEEGAGGVGAILERLRSVNPKYVPREWMLVDAYDRAGHGDYSIVHELYKLFLHPYDEQPGLAWKYYRRAPPEALRRGGCAFMS